MKDKRTQGGRINLAKELFASFGLALSVAADLRGFLEIVYICGLAFVDRRRNFLRRLLLCQIPALFLHSARGGNPTSRLKIRGKIFKVTFPNDAETEFWSIRSTLAEVLVNEVYRPRSAGPMTTVVDAGANYGLATLYLSTYFPHANFVCFEPSSMTCRVLEKNLLENGIRAQVIRKAVSDVDGTAEFEMGRSSMERRIVQGRGCGGAVAETVPVVAIESEMNRIGVSRIDFLKFDVEGQEVHMLDGLGDMLGKIKEVIGETHSDALAVASRRKLEIAGFHVEESAGHLYGTAVVKSKRESANCV